MLKPKRLTSGSIDDEVLALDILDILELFDLP